MSWIVVALLVPSVGCVVGAGIGGVQSPPGSTSNFATRYGAGVGWGNKRAIGDAQVECLFVGDGDEADVRIDRGTSRPPPPVDPTVHDHRSFTPEVWESSGSECYRGVSAEVGLYVWKRRRRPFETEKPGSAGVAILWRTFHGANDDKRVTEISVGAGLDAFDPEELMGPFSIAFYFTNHRFGSPGEATQWSRGGMVSVSMPIAPVIQGFIRDLTTRHR